MAAHITIEDDDDRPGADGGDPDGYFAAARQRAERELAHQSRGLFPALHRKHHR